ncbi:hypothetical protein IDVR_21520 [Intrasporangium sp. DVR]
MTTIPRRIAPRTQVVDWDGGSGGRLRARAASAGRSLPGPGRAAPDPPRAGPVRGPPVRPGAAFDAGFDPLMGAPGEPALVAGLPVPEAGRGPGRAALDRPPPPGPRLDRDRSLPPERDGVRSAISPPVSGSSRQPS